MDHKELTGFQLHKLRTFREQLNCTKFFQDNLHEDEDYFLIPWLKEQNFCVPDAVKMLKEHLEWKNSYPGLKGIEQWKPDLTIVENIEVKYLGYDSIRNRFVVFLPIGLWDPVQVIRIQRRLAQVELGKVSLLIDCDGLSYQKVVHTEGLQFLHSALTAIKKNYPKLLHNAVIINPPWIFSCLLTIAKLVIPKKTMEKITILNKKDGLGHQTDILLEKIPKHLLPVEYGGEWINQNM